MANYLCVSDETLQNIATACRNLHVPDASYCPNISLESVRLPMLTVLKLHSCEGITSASMVAIAFSSMLEVLELDNCSLLTSISFELRHLKSIRLVHCRKFIDLNLRSSVLSSITVSNCPSLQRISITSSALKKLVLQKQESLTTLAMQCDCLQEVGLTDCESLTNSICDVISSGGSCPALRSLVLDNCESLTTVSFHSTSLVSLSLGGCHAITSLELRCPSLEHVSLDDCDHLERASFSPVLKLQTCKYLSDTSLEPLYRGGALPALRELDLSYGTLCQSAIEELLAGCRHLTHVSLNGCVNMHDLDWGSHRGRLSEIRNLYDSFDDYPRENAFLPERQPNRLLQNLNCVGCPNIKKSCKIDEEAIETAITRCNVLETLDVRFCPKILASSMGHCASHARV